MKEWRFSEIPVKKHDKNRKNKENITNNDYLILEFAWKVLQVENIFYEDQKGAGECGLSEEINDEFESQQEGILQRATEEERDIES